jgi:hypothetical protein
MVVGNGNCRIAGNAEASLTTSIFREWSQAALRGPPGDFPSALLAEAAMSRSAAAPARSRSPLRTSSSRLAGSPATFNSRARET